MTGHDAHKQAKSISEMMAFIRKRDAQEGWRIGLAYQPEPTDVFIVTPAKCGTTWMQQIVHGLRTRGSMDFLEITQVVPWIEMAFDMGIDLRAPQIGSPRAFKTHRPLTEVPKGGKYIIVVRNPKDALLSHYHFFNGWIFEKDSVSIEAFAREFYMSRRAYWNHITAFWERRKDENLLVLSYEQMKSHLPGTVEKVARFIGIELDEELKDIVVRQSNFKFMREHSSRFDDHLVRQARFKIWGLPVSEYTSKIRNGQVGESETSLPETIRKEMDQVWQEEITARFGLNSYEELSSELVN